MRKKFLSLFYAFLAAVLCTTSVSAGGSVKLSAAPTFEIGSLIAKGTFLGLGKSGTYLVILEANGPAEITCVNFGTNDVPGQSSPRVSATGQQELSGDNGLLKNGKSSFDVETAPPAPVAWYDAGCPNANWTGRVDFVYWQNATLSVKDMATDLVLFTQDYVCTTTRDPAAVSCTAVQ
jgi:hypothetical protein